MSQIRGDANRQEMHFEHFFAWGRFTRRNDIIQGLLRSHSVKSEESPGCGGETGPAGDDVTSHEICKQIANSQTAHGHGRLRAHVDRMHRANHLRPVYQEPGTYLVDAT